MLTKNRHRHRMFFAAMLISAITHHLSVPSRGENLPEEVAQALKNNTTAVNRLTVIWEWKYSSRLALDDLLTLIKSPGTRGFFETQYETVIYQEGKLWCNSKRTEWIDRKFSKHNSDTAFDGKILYVGNSEMPFEPVAIFDLDYLKKHNPDYFVYYWEYLEASGFKVHNRYGTIDQAPESYLLYLINQGAQISSVRRMAVDSDPCVVVEVTMPGGREVFYLDPARQYAVRKREKYNKPGNLVQETVNSKFVQLQSPPLHLPKQCLIKDYTWSSIPDKIFKEPIIETSLDVKELSQKTWPMDRFVIDYTRPGTFVLDSRPEAANRPGAVPNDAGQFNYRIDAKPEDLARVVGLGRSRWRFLFGALNVIGISLICLFLVYRSRKNRK